MRAVLTIDWPAMPTRHISAGLALTDPIDGDAKLVCYDGQTFRFKVHIPATPVQMQLLLGFIPNPKHWRVDPCVGSGVDFDFTLNLSAEDCYIKIGVEGVYMNVTAMPCTFSVELPDGRKGWGSLEGAACKSWPHGRGEWLVEPVTYGPVFVDIK